MARPLPLSLADWAYSFVRRREQHFYDRDPEGYQRLVDLLQQRSLVARRYCEIVERELGRRPQRCLDLACGTGIISQQLASIADVVVGFDASPSMLSLARARHIGNAEFRQGDFHKLESIEDESVDVVTQFAAARYIEDNRHYSEIARVLRPDGIAVVSHFDARGRDAELVDGARRAGLVTSARYSQPPHALLYLGYLAGLRDQHIWVLRKPAREPGT